MSGNKEELIAVARMIMVSWKNIVRHIFVSFVETMIGKSSTIKSCIEEAQSNINNNNPFHDLKTTHPAALYTNPCNEIALASSSLSGMDKDYGKLKGPKKISYVN
jgi:hypothetical protein